MISEAEKNKGNALESAEYLEKIIAGSFRARNIILLSLFLCVSILAVFFKLPVPSGVFVVLALWMGTSALYLKAFKEITAVSEKDAEFIHFTYYLPGIFFSTAIVHYLGSSEWVAFMIYFFDIIIAGMLLKKKNVKIVVLGTLISYLALLFMEYKAMIPHYRIIPMYEAAYNNSRYLMVTGLLAVGTVFALVAYLVSFFRRVKMDRDMEFLVEKEKVKVNLERIEELSASIKERTEENGILRARAAEYLREREDQIESVKRDMETHIEAQRKTQKAMALMIEDLNEMSRELKKIKDNLEDKVRERTEEIMSISSKLHRSEKLAFLGKLAGSVTHELRNPMAVIRNAAYFLGSALEAGGDQKAREYAGMIIKGVDSANLVIDNIMGFAKNAPLEFEKKDLRDVVEYAVSVLDVPELITVKKDFGDIPLVEISEKQMVHAIVNISNNAIVAMNGKGVLSFKVKKKENNVLVSVSDTGEGIPEGSREIIFEPLYSTRAKGTGLGLAIAKMMVENQNGRIDLESKVGKGTTFTISIPVPGRE